jgi:hypothetical protein
MRCDNNQEGKKCFMSEQKNQLEELNDQALEAVTGGADPQGAKNFLNQLSHDDRQDFEMYRKNNFGSQNGEQLYSQWHKLYTGVTVERAQEIAREVDRKLAQHDPASFGHLNASSSRRSPSPRR